MKSSNSRRKTNFSLYLEEDQIKRLDEIHWRERKSVSELVRDAINEYISNHFEGNKTFSLEKWQENPEFKAMPTLNSNNDTWSKYINSCSSPEITQLAIKNTMVRRIIENRRTREYNQRR